MKNLISIVVPVYKSIPYLPKLNDTLTGQTYKNIEIIYVNDGCPAGSGDLIDQFKATDSRIVTVHQKNGGAVSAVNNGLGIAKGEFIMFIDADDWINYQTCQKAIDIVDKYNVDMVFWLNIKEFGDKSIPYPPFFPENKLFVDQDIHYLRRRMMGLVGSELSNPLSTDAFNAGWGKLYRTSLIKQNGIKWTDTQLVGSSDVLFNAQLMPFIQRAYFLKEYLHHYNRTNPNSLTKNYNNTIKEKYSRLFVELNKVIEMHYPLLDEFKTALQNRIALSTINIGLGYVSGGLSIKGFKLFKEFTNTPNFKQTLSNFDFSKMPIHFGFFFFSLKFRFYYLSYILLFFMSKIRKR